MLLWLTILALAQTAPPSAAEGCGECHEVEWTEWRTSRHAAAATNPVFTAAWEHWPNGWCLQCHAPSEVQQIARLGRVATAGVLHNLPPTQPGPRWADGVDCAACHLDGETILTASPPTDLAESMHKTRQETSLGDERLCARCHEFTLQNHTPVWPFTKSDTPAQATISEWKASTAAVAGTGCIDCHMDQHGHRFPGAHTPSMVRDAIEVVATQQRDHSVLAQISSPGAAHRVPTGDPFRRMVFALCTDASCQTEVARVTLRRVFETTDTTWVPLADRTIPPETSGGPAIRELTLKPSAPAAWWRLTYRYGDAQFEHTLPPDEVGFLIAEGPVLETR